MYFIIPICYLKLRKLRHNLPAEAYPSNKHPKLAFAKQVVQVQNAD